MKISIENFKSIKRLQNFELKPFTILSGVNSSGKSSFVQLLLLLKQTVELDSSSQPFYLDGEFYKVGSFKDIVSNHSLQESLGVSFEFSKQEVLAINSPDLSVYNSTDFTAKVFIQFSGLSRNVFIKEFSVHIETSEDFKKPGIRFKFNGKNYSINTNDILFGEDIWNEVSEGEVNFLSLYPIYIDIKGNKKIVKLDWVKLLINTFLKSISYIGPLRIEPEDGYIISKNHKNVGVKGEYVAQVLEELADKPIQFNKILTHENGIKYDQIDGTLMEGVEYWMCTIFDVADDIQAKKVNDVYEILLVSKSKLLTSIKHVGFGISQLLPIVVEGLRMPDNGTLIIEQPEIHLHPKIQSLLYDFLYGLTLQGKKVIVETHSSHFITRMRRRIAEDESDEMDNRINLTFIENDVFRTIRLNDFGGLDYYPEDFIEQSSQEFSAIVKAQMNKRLKKK